MVAEIKRIRVFLSSPSDVSAERELAKEVCDEINLDLGHIQDFHIELLRWETHASPGIDETAQYVINKRIGDDYDIIVVVLGTRFGTPTKDWRSGTEEEFRIAHERFKTSGLPKILAYFWEAKVDVRNLDIDQLTLVRDFRKELQTHGVLYWPYPDPNLFRINLRRHLIREVIDLLKSPGKLKTTTPEPEAISFDPLSNFNDLMEKSPQAKAFFLMKQSSEAQGRGSALLEKMSKSQDTINRKMKSLSSVLKQAATGRNHHVKRIGTATAEFSAAIDAHLDVMRTGVPIIRSEQTDAYAKLTRALDILHASGGLKELEKGMMRDSLLPLAISIDFASKGITEMLDHFSPMPALGNDFELRRQIFIALGRDMLDFNMWFAATVRSLLESAVLAPEPQA